MHYDRMDDGIRSKLKNHPTTLNTDQLWNKIQAKRNEPTPSKKRRKRPALLLFFLLPIVFSSLFLLKPINFNIDQTVNEYASELSKKSGDNVDQGKPQFNESKSEFIKSITIGKKSNSAASTSSAYSTKTAEKSISSNNKITVPEITANIQSSGNKRRSEKTPKLRNDVNNNSLENISTIETNVILANEHPVIYPSIIDPIRSDVVSKKIKKGVSIYYSPEYALKKLSGHPKTYVDQREKTENIVESWSAGLLYHIYLKNGFSFSTGLNYQKTTERLFWEQSQSSLIKRNDQFFQQTTVREKTHFNTFERIDLPIFIGFQQKKNRLTFGAQAGTFFNLSQKTDGKILAPDSEPGQFISANESVYKKRIAPSYAANLIVGYEIMNGIYATLNPGYKFQTKSITQSTYGIDQQYAYFYLGVGLNWIIR